MNFPPIRCISSHLTSQLAMFRNLQGAEENWLNNRPVINNRAIYFGKVVTTELGSILLHTTAIIEACVYTAFGILSLIATPLTFEPAKHCYRLATSAAFTAYWNFGNALLFNFCYSNLHTHESFARHSMDHSERGELLKFAIVITCLAWSCLAIFTRIPPPNHSSLDSINMKFTRTEDGLFIADTLQGRDYRDELIGEERHDGRVRLLINYAREVGSIVEEGKTFFKNHILRPIAATSRQMVIECDPDIYSFVTTRAIYMFTLGEFRNSPIPEFFQVRTRTAIADLRAQHLASVNNELIEVMLDHEIFDQTQSVILNRLKGIASEEMQGGIFVTRCWQEATRTFNAMGHAA